MPIYIVSKGVNAIRMGCAKRWSGVEWVTDDTPQTVMTTTRPPAVLTKQILTGDSINKCFDVL